MAAAKQGLHGGSEGLGAGEELYHTGHYIWGRPPLQGTICSVVCKGLPELQGTPWIQFSGAVMPRRAMR